VGHGGLQEARKQFFFEKKNQKTFDSVQLIAAYVVRKPTDKSFLVLFFKKELLPFFLHPERPSATMRRAAP
jgi:hypothetical protein